MSNSITPIATSLQNIHQPDAIQSLDERLGTREQDGNVSKLLLELKALSQKSPNLTAADIVAYVRNFQDEGGSHPYKDSRKQVGIIGHLLKGVEAEEGKETVFYQQIKKSFSFAIVFQGTINQFMAKMWEKKDVEEW